MSSGSFDLLGRLVNLLTTVSQRWGTLVDLAEKLNSENGESWGRELSRFLRKEPTWIRRWREDSGVIRFELTSNVWSGQQWIDYFEANGVQIGTYAKQLLLSLDFKVTPAGTVVKVVVLKGESFSDDNRITEKIRVYADQQKLVVPNTDLICLIRHAFTNEDIREMGLLWIVGMAEPINDSDGNPSLLYAACDVSDPWLCADDGFPGGGWGRECGFAFVEQVSLAVLRS